MSSIQGLPTSGDDVRPAKRQRSLEYVDTRRDDIIMTINVGGVRYTTRRSTLLSRGATLGSPLYEAIQMMDDNDNEMFFDRHGPTFEYILDFLRNGIGFVQPIDVETRERVMQEARYFGFNDMIRAMGSPVEIYADVGYNMPDKVAKAEQDRVVVERQAMLAHLVRKVRFANFGLRLNGWDFLEAVRKAHQAERVRPESTVARWSEDWNIWSDIRSIIRENPTAFGTMKFVVAYTLHTAKYENTPWHIITPDVEPIKNTETSYFSPAMNDGVMKQTRPSNIDGAPRFRIDPTLAPVRSILGPDPHFINAVDTYERVNSVSYEIIVYTKYNLNPL